MPEKCWERMKMTITPMARLNHRTDKWGGGAVGRATALLETVRAVRAAVPPGFLLSVRLSPAP
jgi:2,4-dienoyl-CoA reductase-like NADH-dependent reductase (Old Yellow Enzyme family)